MPSKTYSAMMAGQAVLAIAPEDSDLVDLVKVADCGCRGMSTDWPGRSRRSGRIPRASSPSARTPAPTRIGISARMSWRGRGWKPCVRGSASRVCLSNGPDSQGIRPFLFLCRGQSNRTKFLVYPWHATASASAPDRSLRSRENRKLCGARSAERRRSASFKRSVVLVWTAFWQRSLSAMILFRSFSAVMGRFSCGEI